MLVLLASGGVLSQPCQRLRDEPGHLHLRDADLVGDLLLRAPAVEAQAQDVSRPLVEPGQ